MTDSATAGLGCAREALRRFLVGDDDLSTMLLKIVSATTASVPGYRIAHITFLRACD